MKKKISILVLFIISLLVFSNGVFLFPFKTNVLSSQSEITSNALDYSETINNEIEPEISDAVYYNYTQLLNSYENFGDDYDGASLPVAYSIRDDYMLYVGQQSIQGLCWAFSSNMSASTTIMKATNEYMDFSESWISNSLTYGVKNSLLPNYTKCLNSTYLPGSGGYFMGYDIVANEFGLVLDQDFPFEDSFNITKENANVLYNHYIDYSNKDIINNLKPGKFEKYNGSANKALIKNSIKQHILKHGSVYAGLRWTDLTSTKVKGKDVVFKYPSSNTNGGHAISLIGWDDNIQITYNSNTYTGAWIALNSWGNTIDESSGDQGIIYIVYDDPNFDSHLWGYKYQEQVSEDIYLTKKITSSNGKYTTKLKGINYGSFTSSTNLTGQRNIFYNLDNIDMTYSYKISPNTEIKDISILRNGVDVTDNFNITTNKTAKTIKIVANNLEIGAYKVVFTYSNGNKTETDISTFYLVDGTEINYTYYYGYTASDTLMNLAPSGRYENFNNLNYRDRDSIRAITTYETGTFYLNVIVATYNDVEELKCNNSSSVITQKMDDGSYATRIDYDLRGKEYLELTYTLVASTGNTREIDFKLYNYANNSSSWASIIYETNGGVNHEDNDKKMLVSSSKTVIKAPTKEGYRFTGWYLNKNLTNKLAYSNGEYYLSSSNLTKYSTSTVGYQSNYNECYKTSVVAILYAGWEEVPIYYTIKANASSTNGSISPSGDIIVDNNGTQKFTFSVNEGYYIDSILVDGVALNSIALQDAIQNGYTFSNVTSDHTIKVNIEKIAFTITYDLNYIGSTSQTQRYGQGESITPLTPQRTGYDFLGWYKESSCINKQNFTTMPANNFTVYAKWEIKSYSITVSNLNSNYGSVAPFGTFTLEYNSSLRVNFTPNIGCYVSKILVNNVELTGATLSNAITRGYYEFTNISQNNSIEVYFDINKYNITISSKGNGIVSPSGTNFVEYGSNFIVNFIPDEGYYMSKVLVDGAQLSNLTSNYFVFNNVKKNHSLYVEFDVKKLNIEIITNAGGTVDCMKDIYNITYGESRWLEIILKDNYRIESVYVNGKEVQANNNMIYINKITEDLEVKVNFAIISFWKTTAGLGVIVGGTTLIIIVLIVIAVAPSIKKNQRRKVMENNLEQFRKRINKH